MRVDRGDRRDVILLSGANADVRGRRLSAHCSLQISNSERDAGWTGSRQGEEVRFATDSLLEGDGFEPSVRLVNASAPCCRRECRSDRTGKSRDRSIPHERARNPFTSPVCPSASEIAARSPRMRAARDGVAAQRARLRQDRNPTKKSVQSRRISVSGNGTAHPVTRLENLALGSRPPPTRPDSIAKPAAPRAPASHPSEFGAAVLAGCVLYSVFSTKSLSAPDSAPQTSPLRPASCRTPA